MREHLRAHRRLQAISVPLFLLRGFVFASKVRQCGFLAQSVEANHLSAVWVRNHSNLDPRLHLVVHLHKGSTRFAQVIRQEQYSLHLNMSLPGGTVNAKNPSGMYTAEHSAPSSCQSSSSPVQSHPSPTSHPRLSSYSHRMKNPSISSGSCLVRL